MMTPEIGGFALRSNRLLMLLGDRVILHHCCPVPMFQGCVELFSKAICDGVGIEIIYDIWKT